MEDEKIAIDNLLEIMENSNHPKQHIYVAQLLEMQRVFNLTPFQTSID